jgi:hypothetical protein
VAIQTWLILTTVTAPPKDRDRIRAGWSGRLRQVDSHVTQMYVHRHIWEAVRDEIVRVNPATDGQFIESYTRLYAETVMMAIRRLADEDNSTDSLWSLWDAVRRNPESATRADYIALAVAEVEAVDGDSVREQCDRHFTEAFGVGEHVDPDQIAKYQEALRDDSQRVTAFVDKRIAHLDAVIDHPAAQTIDLSQIHGAMDRVAVNANHAHRLLDRMHQMYELVVVPPTWRASLRGLFSPEQPLNSLSTVRR